MNNFLIKLVCALFCTFLLLSEGKAQAPKFSNDFLNIGVGARAHGMANSVGAHVGDLSAAFWNPAGLTNIDVPFQVQAMHAEWFAGVIKYDYLSFGKQFDERNKSFGSISIIRMGVDQIPNTLNLQSSDGSFDYDNIQEFSVADYAGYVSYGRALFNDVWRVGGSLKVIHRTVGTFANSWGFGLDAGLQYVGEKFRFGVMGKDITSTFNAWRFSFTEEEKAVLTQTNNSIPVSSVEYTLPRLTLAGAYMRPLSEKIDFLVEADIDLSTNGQEAGLISADKFLLDPHMGFEFEYNNLIALRAGIGNVQQVLDDKGESRSFTLQPNAGLGLHIGNVQIDYAMTNIGSVSSAAVLYSHVFSLSIDFVRR